MPFGHSKRVLGNNVDDSSIGVDEDGVAMLFSPRNSEILSLMKIL